MRFYLRSILVVAAICLPAVHAQVKAVLTNTMTIAPYRGGGRPEPLYVTETIIDKAAHQLGIDAAELRRRNTVPASAMPYTTAMRQVYDTGDFGKLAGAERAPVEHGREHVGAARIADERGNGGKIGSGTDCHAFILAGPRPGRSKR